MPSSKTQHSDRVRLEPTALRSRVKHSTTELLCSDFTVQLTSDAVNTRYTGLPGVTRGISRSDRLHSQIIFVHKAVVGTGLALRIFHVGPRLLKPQSPVEQLTFVCTGYSIVIT